MNQASKRYLVEFGSSMLAYVVVLIWVFPMMIFFWEIGGAIAVRRYR